MACLYVVAQAFTKVSQLVQSEYLGENVSHLLISLNIPEFDFTAHNPLANEMVVHFDMLGTSVEDRVLCKLDVVEVVAIDHRPIDNLYLQFIR